jgi:hypothetical protein
MKYFSLMTFTITKKWLYIFLSLLLVAVALIFASSRNMVRIGERTMAKRAMMQDSIADMALSEGGEAAMEVAAPSAQMKGASVASGGGGVARSLLMTSEAQAQESNPGSERKLIRRGEMHYTTSDLDAVRAKVLPVVKEENAFFAGERQHEDANGRHISITIRVPWQRFENLFEKLAKLDEVKYRNVSVDDVTLQHIDLSERVRNKEKLRDRYRELVSRAPSMNDILQIEQNLTRLSEEIDSSKSQLRYMDQQISLSTITLQFREPRIAAALEEPYRFWMRAKKAFIDGWFSSLSFLLFFVNLWPFLLVIGAGIWIWRKKRKA